MKAMDMQGIPPPLLKANHPKCEKGSCFLKPRCRRWYQNCNFEGGPNVPLSAPIEQVNYNCPTGHFPSASQDSCVGNNMYYDQNQALTNQPDLVQTENDFLDVLLEGDDKRNNFEVSDKSTVFSPENDSCRSPAHLNFYGFSEKESVADYGRVQPGGYRKITCSSSNNNNNTEYESVFDHDIFGDENARQSTIKNFCLDHTRKENCDQASFALDISRENVGNLFSDLKQLKSFGELNDQNNTFSYSDSDDKASNSMALPPISLLSGKKCALDEEKSFAAQTSNQEATDFDQMDSKHMLEMRSYTEEHKVVEDRFFAKDASGYCLYGQREKSLEYETSPALKNMYDSK